MTCKLWIEDGWFRTAVRADQVLAVRATALRHVDQNSPQWQIELITDAALGGNGEHVVPLCQGSFEGSDTDACGVVVRMIAEHIDDPAGGTIDCAHESVADELYRGAGDVEYDSVLDAMFVFHSFAMGRGPRPVRTS